MVRKICPGCGKTSYSAVEKREKVDWLSEFADIIEVVDEPDYSRSIIKEMEEKYGMTSDDFYEVYKSDTLNCRDFDKDDIAVWAHHIEVLQLLEGAEENE